MRDGLQDSKRLWLTRFKIKTYISPTLHLYDLKHQSLISFFLQEFPWNSQDVFKVETKMCTIYEGVCEPQLVSIWFWKQFSFTLKSHSMHAFRFGGNYTSLKCWKLSAHRCQNFGNSKHLSRLCLRSIISLFLSDRWFINHLFIYA
jgi:hypothetical protein